MSESLFDRARDIADADMEERHRKRTLEETLAAMEKDRQRESRGRVAEFIGAMLEHDVPKIPLYRRELKELPWYRRDDVALRGYAPLGQGWVVPLWALRYCDNKEDELYIENRIFVTTQQELHPCQEPTYSPPSDVDARWRASPRGASTEYALAEQSATYTRDGEVKLSWNPIDTATIFAGNGGDNLARELIKRNIIS